MPRFVFAGEYLSAPEIKKAFPNVRAAFHLSPGVMNQSDTTEIKEDYTPYNAQMTVFRPVRMDTLMSLLAYPVKWLEKRRTMTQAINGISGIAINTNGALLPPLKRKDVEFRNLVPQVVYLSNNGHAY